MSIYSEGKQEKYRWSGTLKIMVHFVVQAKANIADPVTKVNTQKLEGSSPVAPCIMDGFIVYGMEYSVLWLLWVQRVYYIYVQFSIYHSAILRKPAPKLCQA